ncbi:MAG: biopolymer transporter ExbD [Bacteroidota bacterium]
MADIHAHQNEYKGKRTTRKSGSIDMTAMVDVAFLLLTFFVLTATLQEEKLLELVMPPSVDGEPARAEVLEERVLTLVLKRDNKISYYYGGEESDQDLTSFSPDGVRKLILDHVYARTRTQRIPICVKQNSGAPCWDPVIVIKPMPDSRYQNLVDLLDELVITGAPKYAIDNSASSNK